MAELAKEIACFESQKKELEAHHFGKYVVIKDEKVIGTWDTMDAAATEAVRQFGRGPYLIRQIGAPRMSIPASVYARPVTQKHAHS